MLRAAISRNIPLIVALTFLVEMPLVILVSSGGVLRPVVAYHVMDVSAEKVGWLSFFFWAAFALPLAWISCFVLAIMELVNMNRSGRLATYVGVPAAVAAAYWFSWEIFTNFLP